MSLQARLTRLERADSGRGGINLLVVYAPTSEGDPEEDAATMARAEVHASEAAARIWADYRRPGQRPPILIADIGPGGHVTVVGAGPLVPAPCWCGIIHDAV